MNKFYNLLILIIVYLVAPCLLVYAWYNFKIFIPASEVVWSLFNKITGEVNVGYASDLEFIFIFFMALILSHLGKIFVLTKLSKGCS